MAIGVPIDRGSNFGAFNATVTLSPTANIAAGTRVVLYTIDQSSANAFTGVTDTKSNTWTQDYTPTSPVGYRIAFYSSILANGLTTSDTLTFSTTDPSFNGKGLWLFEVSGIASSSYFDQGVSATGSGTTFNSGNTSTLTQADELAIAVLHWNANNSGWATPSGWTTLSTSGGGNSAYYQIASTTAALGFSGTASFSHGWYASQALYKGVAAPAGAGASGGVNYPTSLLVNNL